MNILLLSTPKIIGISFAGAAGFILLAIFITSYVCYRMTFKVDKKTGADLHYFPFGEQFDAVKDTLIKMVNETAALPFEERSIISSDGLKLKAKYYHTAPGAPLQIMFHGYKGNSIRDFSGGIKHALDGGFNVLLVDQRAHGKSEGRCLSFGIKERLDVLNWASFAQKELAPSSPILLVGISMGGATVLMASDLDLPKNVCAIVADCPYSSPKEIIKKTIGEMKLPVRLFYPFVRLGGMIYGGFDVEKTDALTAVQNAKVPILYIHGDDDRFVPCDMSKRCFNATKTDKQLSLFRGAGHGLSYVVCYDEYCVEVQKFYDKYIPKSK